MHLLLWNPAALLEKQYNPLFATGQEKNWSEHHSLLSFELTVKKKEFSKSTFEACFFPPLAPYGAVLHLLGSCKCALRLHSCEPCSLVLPQKDLPHTNKQHTFVVLLRKKGTFVWCKDVSQVSLLLSSYVIR